MINYFYLIRVSLGSALGGEGDVAISPGTTYVVRLELRPPASFASQPVNRLVLHAPPVPNPSQDVARGAPWPLASTSTQQPLNERPLCRVRGAWCVR